MIEHDMITKEGNTTYKNANTQKRGSRSIAELKIQEALDKIRKKVRIRNHK